MANGTIWAALNPIRTFFGELADGSSLPLCVRSVQFLYIVPCTVGPVWLCQGPDDS